MTSIVTLLKKCYKYHDLHPFDPLHDSKHHRQVVKNVTTLVRVEKLKSRVNFKPLLIAASLHDAIDEKRGSSIALQLQNLKDYMNKIRLSDDITVQAISILKSHSYGKDQQSVEQKLLYDSDKIEYSSKKRVDIGVKAVKNGKLTDERFRYYFRLWAERVPYIQDTLHYKTSMDLFISNSKAFFDYVKSKYPEYFPLIQVVRTQVDFL